MIKLIKPYTRIHLPYLAKELNIDVNDVENLLVQCILDGTVKGKMDQVNLHIFYVFYAYLSSGPYPGLGTVFKKSFMVFKAAKRQKFPYFLNNNYSIK